MRWFLKTPALALNHWVPRWPGGSLPLFWVASWGMTYSVREVLLFLAFFTHCSVHLGGGRKEATLRKINREWMASGIWAVFPIMLHYGDPSRGGWGYNYNVKGVERSELGTRILYFVQWQVSSYLSFFYFEWEVGIKFQVSVNLKMSEGSR